MDRCVRGRVEDLLLEFDFNDLLAGCPKAPPALAMKDGLVPARTMAHGEEIADERKYGSTEGEGAQGAQETPPMKYVSGMPFCGRNWCKFSTTFLLSAMLGRQARSVRA